MDRLELRVRDRGLSRPGQRYVLASRAVSNAGEQQVDRWNPNGYARNAVEYLTVKVNA